MFFLSKIIGTRIYGKGGNFVGALKDLSVSLHNGYPPITGLIVGDGSGNAKIPWSRVREVEESQIILSCRKDELKFEQIKENEVLLSKDIMDKQIFDTEDRKLIRVQDVHIGRVEGALTAVAVDVSFRAIVRRLGFEMLLSGFKEKLQPKLIDWKNLSFLGVEEHDIRLRVMDKRVEMLHPADIADIISELSPEHRKEILGALDRDIAADTIEELEPPYQASALADLETQKASEILGEIEPDKAADIVADLPKDKAKELLDLLKDDEALEIRQLLRFPEDSAGGIMTTEFVEVPEDFTADEAMKVVREMGRRMGTIAYIYVVDGDKRLKGAFSLKELIIADPKDKVCDFMRRHIISVDLLTQQDEVAKLVAKYDILAVPVVDEQRRLRGIVTIDDALDVIIPTKWKKRFPRIY